MRVMHPTFPRLWDRRLKRAFNERAISQAQLTKLRAFLRTPKGQKQLAKCHDEVCKLAAKDKGRGINWQGILEWIKANWPTILKIILSLLVFLI